MLDQSDQIKSPYINFSNLIICEEKTKETTAGKVALRVTVCKYRESGVSREIDCSFGY